MNAALIAFLTQLQVDQTNWVKKLFILQCYSWEPVAGQFYCFKLSSPCLVNCIVE